MVTAVTVANGSRRTELCPIPLYPPVTTATWSLKFMSMVLRLFVVGVGR